MTLPFRTMRYLLLLAAGCLGLPPSSAHAVGFSVRARVFCVAHLEPSDDGETIDPTFTRPLRAVPCVGVKVSALDAISGPDSYCGAAYTDSSGTVSFRAECSRFLGRQPQVYLRIEGQSLEGFRVATSSFDWTRFPPDATSAGLDAFVREQPELLSKLRTFHWLTKQRAASDGAVLDWGAIALGSGSRESLLASEILWAAAFSARYLRRSGHLPTSATFWIDHPFSGQAPPLRRTVLMDHSFASHHKPRMLSSIPHSFGQLLMNRYHGAWSHWASDARFLEPRLESCALRASARAAWYDGFADFVQAATYSGALDVRPDAQHLTGGKLNFEKPRACPASGERYAGNSAEFLARTFFGEVRADGRTRHASRTDRELLPSGSASNGGSPGPMLTLPSLADLFALATQSHTPLEAVRDQLRSWCAARESGGSPRACGGPRFEEMLRRLFPEAGP